MNLRLIKSKLKNKFIPRSKEILNWSKQNWPDDIGFEKRIPRTQQILSPSDFGFHNVIKTKQGLRFIDFEYFGWDDPVKLITDFIWHPAMDLSEKHKNSWLKKSFKIFKNTEEKTPKGMPIKIAIKSEVSANSIVAG